MHLRVVIMACAELGLRGGVVKGRDQSVRSPWSYERDPKNMAMDGQDELVGFALGKCYLADMLLRKFLASRGGAA
jgi:hypothetical protein